MDSQSRSLFERVSDLAQESGSLYRDIRPCRDDLLGFMDANEWFGQTVSGSGDGIRMENMDAIEDRLRLWIRAYRRSPKEKTDILLESYGKRYPITCKLFGEFLEERGEYGKVGALRVLDYLLSSINREIVLYSEEDLQEMIRGAKQYLAITNTQLLLTFFTSLKQEGVRLAYHYEVTSRRVVERENDAYSLQDFARMAYWTFHPDSWREHRLVEKAAADPRCAGVWLYVALHFVCAWRSTDLERLPLPELPYSAEETRQRILDGLFTNAEARALVRQWLYLTDLLGMKPQKTQEYSDIPTLKIFIPEILEQPFGIILALAVSHRSAGEACVDTYCEKRLLEMFFGSEFAEIAGKRRFLSRRANKAFLQGIEASAEDKPGKPKGYMLAALARSHKGSIGTLSEITDIYLRDENFTGYKPEFILREMFERGIFGFVPAMLLEACFGSMYRRLPVSSQTELIRFVGLTPFEIEQIASAVVRNLKNAQSMVKTLVNGSQSSLADVLQTVAVGATPAKQPEMLCLRIAAGMTCSCPNRSCCIGCGFEIYTKAALQILMQEYTQLSWKCSHAEGWEKERFRALLLEGIFPPVGEILSSVPMLYPEADMASLNEIVERGMCNAAALER